MTHIPPWVSGNTLHKAFTPTVQKKQNKKKKNKKSVYLTCPEALKYTQI